jgi:hypothetical protein
VGAEAISHDGRPRGSEKPKPTTFETLTSLATPGEVDADSSSNSGHDQT